MIDKRSEGGSEGERERKKGRKYSGKGMKGQGIIQDTKMTDNSMRKEKR